MRQLKLAGGLLAAAVIAVGCSDRTEQRTKEAAQATGAAVESAAHDTAQNAEKAKDAVVNATRDARNSDTARDANALAKEAAAAGGAAIETAQIKAALIADSRVTATDIDVDTDHRTRTVTLKGHVPSATQRTVAGEIAKKKAEGYTIINDLAVP